MSVVRSCSNPVCGNTESRPGEFKKCSRCKQACYCSKECQLQHWKNGHKKECKAVNEPNNQSNTASESKLEASTEQRAILRKECQTMYNNYEMAKNDLEVATSQLEKAKTTKNSLSEADKTKSIPYAFGSMYMRMSYEQVEAHIDGQIEKYTKEVEKIKSQMQYFEKRYKEMESNLLDM